MVSFLNLQPSPSALIQSLRDIGYTMESAVADIIDNSITAGAVHINIRFTWNDGEPWLAIADDGHGMAGDELTDAMRLGSKAPLELRGADDLGRFGLGMKTASFSQCRRLTVISRKNGILSGREWNLNLIESDPETGWKLRVIESEEISDDKIAAGLLSYIESDGTIVLWRDLDRFDNSEKKLNSLINNTGKHLELVFHRFLSPQKPQKKLKIFINGGSLVAFNPFNALNPATQELPEQIISIEGERIIVQPYVLPHYSKTARDDYEKYGSEGGYLQNQGFYVYRNKRLIIKGTWFRLIKKEELTKLIRVQVDIPNSLDHLWRIDVKKSQASPPELMRDELKTIINRIASSGKRVYRQRGKRISSQIKEPAWERTASGGKIHYSINRNHSLIRQYTKQLDHDQSRDFEIIVSMLESSFPTDLFYSDVAKKPESVNKPEFKIEEYSHLVASYIETMRQASIPETELLERLFSIDPFAGYQEEIKELIKEKGMLDE